MSSMAHSEAVQGSEQEHEHESEGRSVNWWGMIFFIASEALIFANLIAAYLYLEIRQGSNNWVLPSTGEHLDVIYPAINTAFLLLSSGTLMISNTNLRKGKQGLFKLFLFLTIVLGLVFLTNQAIEYSTLFGENFNPQYQTFGSSFFTLTGFHGLHVTVGVIFLIICLVRGLRGDFTAKRHFAFQAGEMYWHFVDLVWVAVFSIVYLLPLLMKV